MSNLDVIAAAQAAVYGTMGIDIVWTPIGAAPVTLRALPMMGDQVVHAEGFGAMNSSVRGLKVRCSEMLAATATPPQQGDAVTFQDPLSNADVAVVINATPRREDPRQLEWTIEIGDA